MHFDNFCLLLLNCFAQIYCFDLMIDSERILGVVEPEGFTRAEVRCPEGEEILVRRVQYGYRVSSSSHPDYLMNFEDVRRETISRPVMTTSPGPPVWSVSPQTGYSTKHTQPNSPPGMTGIQTCFWMLMTLRVRTILD